MWDPDESENNNSEVLEGAFESREMAEIELRAIHEFVICNLKATEPLREYHTFAHPYCITF